MRSTSRTSFPECDHAWPQATSLRPLLTLWGRHDTSFTLAGAEAYKKDDPRSEFHILDAGHFALDLKPKEIIGLIESFMAKQDIL